MLDGKIVLVTGATRGIGKAIALKMGGAGATVIGTATSEAGANSVSKMLENNKISGNLKLEKYLFFYFFELIHFLAFSNASNHGETSSFLPSG